MWRYHSSFNHSPMYGHLDGFLYLAFTNSTPINNTVYMLLVFLKACLQNNFLETELPVKKVNIYIALLDIDKFSWGSFNTYKCPSHTPRGSDMIG